MIRARRLSDRTLARHAGSVSVPTYDRHALVPSVVHMSVGSFHRSHQAMYFDALAEQGITNAWGLVGVGLRRPEMRAALAAQDGLYTVVARGVDGDEARVVGVIGRYLFAPEDRAAVVDALADARTRVVTLTITRNGYKVDPATGHFASDDADVLADLATPTQPRSALGFLVEALDRRRRAGLPPFTVLSCDNAPDNGTLTRRAVCSFARLRDPALADWIADHGAFPSSMVDRITPQTTDEDREMVARQFGIRDRWPVITEPFSQWVVEDRFSDGRPPLDAVGVRFVDDVRPYALVKTRMLNGSHCALGPLGYLAGHRTTDGAVSDRVFRHYLRRMMADEIAPILPPPAGLDLERYRESVLRRLANATLADPLARLCRNGSVKVPQHIVSSIVEIRARGGAHPLLTMAVAGWLRYLRGTDENGEPVPIEDPAAERLQVLARAGGTDPRGLLAEPELFGPLGEDEAFADELEEALVRMQRVGTREALAVSLQRTGSRA
jgi:fructuronate reductase/mannitol 2-dehydrogenase